MQKVKSVSIIGSGIVGLITAATIKNFIPNIVINIYDAGGHPEGKDELVGTTFGKGRDARHFTGSESLSFQNPVHSRALRLSPGEHKDWAGWRLIPENELTENERRWRSESTKRFIDIGHEDLNLYDDLHAQFNYAGMTAWEFLEKQLSYVLDYRVSEGPVSVFFLTKQNFEDDLKSETSFLKRFGPENKNVIPLSTLDYNTNFENLVKKEFIFPKALQVPGSSWRIRSLGLKLLEDLEKQGVIVHWNTKITKSDNLNGEAVIWTAGTTHDAPDIYKKYSLIQGIAGCWVTIPNRGFTKPFKISLPQPSGYINCTPDKDVMHISGGFGWVGERTYAEAYQLMEPISDHFKQQINRYFDIGSKQMSIEGDYPIVTCIRPSSPTGLPDARVIDLNRQQHVILTGSGKSGSTQAPLLALFALSIIDPQIVDSRINNPQIKNALNSLNSLYKIHTFGKSKEYPAVLERDLFGSKN